MSVFRNTMGTPWTCWCIYTYQLLSDDCYHCLHCMINMYGDRLCTCVNTHTHMHIYIYIYTHTHTHMYTYIYTHTHTCIHIYMYKHTHIHIHIHTCVYIYIQLYTSFFLYQLLCMVQYLCFEILKFHETPIRQYTYHIYILYPRHVECPNGRSSCPAAAAVCKAGQPSMSLVSGHWGFFSSLRGSWGGFSDILGADGVCHAKRNTYK